MSLTIKVEFSGGLELLFSNIRTHQLSLPALVDVPSDNATKKPADVSYLITYLRDNLLKERPELFEENGTVYVPSILMASAYTHVCRRPGILVLINDTDWELEGEGEYVLKDGDEVVFISTLHGG